MADFKDIKTDDPDLTRVQQNVKTAFAALPAATDLNFVTTSGPQYRIDGTETHVFVDASSRAVSVVLPASDVAPIIKRIDSSAQKVTVQAIDEALIDGAKTFTLAKLAALHLVFDGKAWWSV
jgi:hypothetical protein